MCSIPGPSVARIRTHLVDAGRSLFNLGLVSMRLAEDLPRQIVSAASWVELWARAGGQLQGVPVQGWTWGRSLTKGPGIKHLSASKASVALSSGEATSPRLGRACLGPRLVVGVVGVATDLFVRQGRASAVEPPMTGSIQEIGPKNVLTHQPAGPRFEPQ